MVQIEIGDLPTTQFTAGAVAKLKGCTIKEAHEALAPLVASGSVTSKTAKSGAVNYKLAKNAANAKKAGTAPKSVQTSPEPETETVVDGLAPDGSNEQYEAAKTERDAVKQWKANGEQGEKPATPNLDRMHRIAEENGGKMPKTKTKRTSSKASSNGESSPRGTTVRFYVDGKPMPDSQNKLSSVAWYHTAGVCGDDSKRCSVTELRNILAAVKPPITDPSNTVWTVELSNGKTISTKKL